MGVAGKMLILWPVLRGSLKEMALDVRASKVRKVPGSQPWSGCLDIILRTMGCLWFYAMDLPGYFERVIPYGSVGPRRHLGFPGEPDTFRSQSYLCWQACSIHRGSDGKSCSNYTGNYEPTLAELERAFLLLGDDRWEASPSHSNREDAVNLQTADERR